MSLSVIGIRMDAGKGIMKLSKLMARGAAAVIVAFGAAAASAAEVPLLRISTENSAGHVHTRAVQRFADDLQRRAGGALEVRLFHSAELFRDRDVVKALRQGKVEMAVPGTWQLDRFDPNVGIFLLPIFYGRDAKAEDRVRDGEIGEIINGSIESRLGVKVIGRWIDLGFAHVYSVERPIQTHRDLAGMRIRIAGGEANALRVAELGAEPRTIPWPDLPAALDQGLVNGVLTTHETVASARLWENGLRYVFEDRQYFPQYVPMVAEGFWRRLPESMRRLIVATWESHVVTARAEAAAAQVEAREVLQRNGVKIVVPSEASLTEWRTKLLARQHQLVQSMGIDPLLVERVAQTLERAP